LALSFGYLRSWIFLDDSRGSSTVVWRILVLKCFRFESIALDWLGGSLIVCQWQFCSAGHCLQSLQCLGSICKSASLLVILMATMAALGSCVLRTCANHSHDDPVMGVLRRRISCCQFGLINVNTAGRFLVLVWTILQIVLTI
jgi:hypothetical protein